MRRLALVAVLALTACANQADTPSPSPSPTFAPLTVAQATNAALRVSDLPKGWEGGVAPDRTPTIVPPITYDPAECQVLRDPLRDRDTPTTTVRGQYFLRAQTPDEDAVVTEVIASWPASQLPLVQRIAEALPRCETVAGSISGESFKISVRQIPVRGLRDGIVLRIGDPDDPRQRSASYSAFVARGGTVLALRADSRTFTTDAAFVRFATTAVARLDAVG